MNDEQERSPFFEREEDFQSFVSQLYEEWRNRPKHESVVDFDEWKVGIIAQLRASNAEWLKERNDKVEQLAALRSLLVELEMANTLKDAQIRTMHLTYQRDDQVGKAVKLLVQSKQCVEHAQERGGEPTKPIDPSPTPWDYSTWGFYCDHCAKFFDLLRDGNVVTVGGPDETNTYYHTYQHKVCGKEARYIGYDHNAVKPRTPATDGPLLNDIDRQEVCANCGKPYMEHYGDRLRCDRELGRDEPRWFQKKIADAITKSRE